MTATVDVMAPQRRGVLRPGAADRILALRQAVDDAQLALEKAVADELKHGASLREMTADTGLANQTVQSYGRKHGWPTPAQVAEREAAKDRRRRIREILEEGKA